MWIIPKDNPEGRAFMTLIVFFLVVAAFSFSLRIWARRIRNRSLDASDYACFFGFLLDVGLTVIIWAVFSHGWGQDIRQFTLDDAKWSAKLFVAIDVIWNAAVTTVRCSILLFYIEIFSIQRFRRICWVVIGLNLASMVAVVVSTGLICDPIAYSYDRTIPGGHCGDLNAFERYTAVWNLLADATIVVLPMPILWSLQMRTRKKVGLSIVFGMGIIICILTLTRVFISQYYERNNVTKQNAIVALITGLEPVIGVINACLPFFPPVLHRIGDSKLYLNIRRSFRSTKLGSDYGQATSSHRSNRHDVGSSRSRKVPHSSKQKNRFKGLSDPDTEMDMLHQAYRDIGHQRSYKISVGSLTNPGNACEEGTLPSPPSQVWDANMPRIQVRKDFSVDSDTRV